MSAPAGTSDPLVVCESLVRIHQHGPVEVQALQGLDLAVDSGEMIAVVGPSGSGKSTLLSVLAGADQPSAGRVRVAGLDLTRMSRTSRLDYRRRVVGLVRQQTARNLVPYLTARANVVLPLALAGHPRRRRQARADELLESMGVGHCVDRLPGEMSGASSSGRRSRWRSRTARGSCSPTSRPASWTSPPPRRSSACCGPPTGRPARRWSW